MEHLAIKLAAGITLMISFIGCASVDPKAFEQFHKSTAAFQSGTDGAYETAYEMAAKGYATPSPFGIEPTFDELLLTWEEGGDPTRPTQEEKPLHAMLRDQRRGSYDLNGAIAEYSQYLVLLASGSAKDAEALDELAKNANANMRSARDALSVPVDDGEIAIVATIGAELLRQKIEKDRRDFLRETMNEAQPRIEAFSGFMVVTMDLLAGDITQTYLNWAEAKRLDHDAEGRTDKAKRKVLIDLLERNDRVLLLLDAVRIMRDGYARVPHAHAEVRKRLDDREAFLAAVRRLYDDARRLQRLQKELSSARDA